MNFESMTRSATRFSGVSLSDAGSIGQAGHANAPKTRRSARLASAGGPLPADSGGSRGADGALEHALRFEAAR